MSVSAHPFGGVVQQTVVSDLTNAILIEYNTHFGPEIVLNLHPDVDANGVLDAAERKKFFARVRQLLSPNISCRLGTRLLDIQEIDRRLSLEDEGNFQKGLNTTFVWLVSLMNVRGASYKLLRITDNNFKPDEINQLSYVANVLGRTGPMTLEDGGRQLVLDLSARNRTVTSSDEVLPTNDQPSSEPLSALGGNSNQSETDSLIALLGDKSWGVKLYFIGFFTAFVLGALHALAPGKVMMAAYLVGIRGRVIEAIQLGAVVTATHLTSVVVLGILALMLSHFTISEDIYPWLGVLSGILIFLTGYFMMARMALHTNGRRAGEQVVSSHSQLGEPVYASNHGDPGIGLQLEGCSERMEGMHSLRDIISLGVAEGIVPCPSAIVILLFAVTANRIGTGVLLILSFSLGLAAVLIPVGILTVSTSSHLERFGFGMNWVRRLPIFTAGIIMILGFAIGLNALYQAGILAFNF